MGFPRRNRVSVTTAADGTATAYSEAMTGELVGIRYIKGTFEDTVDFNISNETSQESAWIEANVTASKAVRPVLAASMGGTGGASSLTERPLFFANERAKIVIAQGGNAKSGVFDFIIA